MKKILLLSATFLISFSLFANKEKTKKTEKNTGNTTLSLTWQEMGPSNIAGKINAILVDRNNSQKYYAAAASGGLWVTTDAGLNWSKLKDNFDNNIITSLTYGADGTMYVGTGEYLYGYLGGGIFKSTDNGVTFSRIASTIPTPNDTVSDFAYINAIACHPTQANKIYVATNKGLKITNDGGTTWLDVFGAQKFPATDIKIGVDGTFYLAQDAFRPWQNNRFRGTTNLYTSTSGDTGYANWTCRSSWIKTSDFDTTNIKLPTSYLRSSIGTTRDSAYGIKVAVSPQDPNYVYALVVRLGKLGGIFKSVNKGASWVMIGPGNSSLFNPFANATASAAYAITVSPSNKEEILVGGTDLWNYSNTRGWNQVATSSSVPFLSDYVSKGIQTIVYSGSTVIVGTSTGISKTNAISIGNPQFLQINSNLRTSSLSNLAPKTNGNIIAGTESQGCLFIPSTSGFSIGSALGGDTVANIAVSMIAPEGVFVAKSYGQLARSSNGGEDFNSCTNSRIERVRIGSTPMIGTTNSPRLTPMDYWENFSDPLSKDSILYTYGGSQTIPANTPFSVRSPNGLIPFNTTVPFDLVQNATVKVLNPITSKMVAGFNNEIWMANRMADFIGTPEWFRIASSANTIGTVPNKSKYNGGLVSKVKFTNNGNTVFVGSESGQLFRITNLSNAADSVYGDIGSNKSTVIGKLIGIFPRRIADIATDPTDSNKIIVVLGGGYNQGDYLYRCASALTAPAITGTAVNTSNFELIQNNMVLMPVYSAIVDYTDGNKVLLGTEAGVYGTDNAWDVAPSSVSWSDVSNGIAKVPILKLTQQTFGSEFGIAGSGIIYAASAGRGAFKTNSLANGINPTIGSESIANNKLKIYPNPANDFVNLEYKLIKDSDVSIRIFDMNGKLIQEYSSKNVKSGDNKVKLEVGNMAQGVYMVTITGNEIKDFNTLIISR